jgi:hypothetical protein
MHVKLVSHIEKNTLWALRRTFVRTREEGVEHCVCCCVIGTSLRLCRMRCARDEHTWRKWEMLTMFLFEPPKGRYHPEGLGIDGSIILKRLLIKNGWRLCTAFIWISVCTGGGLLWTRQWTYAFHIFKPHFSQKCFAQLIPHCKPILVVPSSATSSAKVALLPAIGLLRGGGTICFV